MATYKIIVNCAGCYEEVLTLDTDLSNKAVAGIFNQFVQSVLGEAKDCELDGIAYVKENDLQMLAATGRLYWYEMEAFLIDIYKTN